MIPVVTIQPPDQSGGAVKRKPGRPKGSADKRPRRKRGEPKLAPHPRGPSEATLAARRRLRAEEAQDRQVFDVDGSETPFDADLKRNLRAGKLTAAEARDMRRDFARTVLTTRQEESRLQRALQAQQDQAEQTRESARREADRTRGQARDLAKKSRQAIAQSPLRTRANRLATGAAHPNPLHSPGGGAQVPATPLAQPLPGASGLTPSGTPAPLPQLNLQQAQSPPALQQAYAVLQATGVLGSAPAPAPNDPFKSAGVPEPRHKKHCGSHVKHACKQSMKHAEKHGRDAAKEHMAELKEMEDGIRDTRRYIRSLPKK